MNKHHTKFKINIGEFESTFYFESDCSTDIARAACNECLKWIQAIEDAAKPAQDAVEIIEPQTIEG